MQPGRLDDRLANPDSLGGPAPLLRGDRAIVTPIPGTTRDTSPFVGGGLGYLRLSASEGDYNTSGFFDGSRGGIAPYLVVSREAYIINNEVVTSQRDQEQIVSLIPNGLSKLIVAGVTHSTHDEALRARQLVDARGWKRIILVTSPTHTRRACATFEKAGVTVICHPSSTRAIAIGKIFAPTDRLKAFQLWLYETAGTIRYRQLGWM